MAMTSPAGTGSQGLLIDSLEPSSKSKRAKDEPAAETEPIAPPKKRSHTNLPWLIVLLAAAIAAAGLAAYFIYLRDFWV
jgi:hypothetical protein